MGVWLTVVGHGDGGGRGRDGDARQQEGCVLRP